MAKTNAVLNPRKRRLLRSHVPTSENLATLSLMCVLAAVIAWVALQKSNYDPRDRDIAIELLRNADAPELYSQPLKTWTEDGAAEQPGAVDLSPFPAAVLDSEWRPAARLKRFNASNLYEKINGEAERFLRQGFQALHYLVLESKADGAEIAIELFDQGDLKGSMGIFSQHLSGDNEIEQDGQVVFFPTSIGLIGRRGRFFFRVAGDRQTEQIQTKARQLIEAFALLEDNDSGESEAFRMLRQTLDIPAELITYQAKNVFQYDFAEDFWFGGITKESSERVFAHLAPSAADAERLFEQLLEEQSYEYQLIERNGPQAVLRHEYLKNYFAMMHRGRFLVGVENATDPDRVASIQRQFARSLSSGE
jgi:hypothetical protein